jgi:outer membrane protein assembly factor BamB
VCKEGNSRRKNMKEFKGEDMKMHKAMSVVVFTCLLYSLLLVGKLGAQEISNISGMWSGEWTSVAEGYTGAIAVAINQSGTAITGLAAIIDTDFGDLYSIQFTGNINNNIVSFRGETAHDGHSIIIDFTHGAISSAVSSDGMQIHDGIYHFYYDGQLWDNGSFYLDRNRYRWVFGAGAARSSPAIGTDGTIYLTADSYGTPNYLWAINQDGTEKWRAQPWPSWANQSQLAIGADGTIYVGSSHNYLYAINTDGTLKWEFQCEYGVQHIAIGPDETIYVSGDMLCAINPNGTLKWNSGVYGYTAPAIGADGVVYVGTTIWNSGNQEWDGYVYAINPDGTLKWSYKADEHCEFTIISIGGDGTLYLGVEYNNNLYAINSDGTLKWKFLTGGRIYSSPAIGTDGTIYFGSQDYYLYAVNPNGTLKWRFPTQHRVVSSPAIGSNGTIYVGSIDKYLYAVNPDGTLRWMFDSRSGVDSSPAIGSDGTVYFASWGYLYALNSSSKGLASSSWPMIFHGVRHTGDVLE